MAAHAFIVAGMNDIPGISCLEPQGAFYVFPNITGTGLTSAQLQALLLQDAGVAALAGTAFGTFGEGFLRFSYANSVENIQAALEVIRAQLAEISAPCKHCGPAGLALVTG